MPVERLEQSERTADIRQKSWEIDANPNISLDMITPEILEALIKGWAEINRDRAQARGVTVAGDGFSQGQSMLLYGDGGRPGLIERISISPANNFSEDEIRERLKAMAAEIIERDNR